MGAPTLHAPASQGEAPCHRHAARNAVAAGGGVIHFDGAGDPDEILRTVLGYHQLDNADAAQAAEVCILTHAAMGQGGKTANKSIRWAGLCLPQRYSHKGSAGMHAIGCVFDPCNG